METKTSPSVLHLDLCQTTKGNWPTRESFWVIWYKDWPLGHFWYQPQPGLSTQAWALQLWRNMEKLSPPFSPAEWQAWALEFFTGQGDPTMDWTFVLEPLYQKFFSPPQSQPSLTVVICTRNRPQDLVHCLKALFQSTDLDFETIVVDNAPSDDQTALAIAPFPQVRYVLEPQKGLDNARNRGAQMAKGQLVAFTDDDVVVHPGWTSRIKAAFDAPHTMAITGLVLPQQMETLSAYVFEKHWGFNRGYQRQSFGPTYFNQNLPFGVPVWDIGAGANMAFRQQVFGLVGLFDPRLDVGASGCSGDSEFWYRILAEGWTCQYDPRAVVFHRHRETRADLKRQLNGYMRGQVSSLLVQYERWGHMGNLKRVFKYLPQYYVHRMWAKIKGKDRLLNLELWAEIKGCLQGTWYYWQHRQNKQKHLPYPLGLHQPVAATAQSLVTVVITNYNYGRFLEQCIQSVVQQTHGPTEIIVVDDGSTDESEQILAKFSQVQVLHTQRKGVSVARNIGAAAAKGEFILFLDADDWLVSEALEIQLYHFRQYPSVVMVGGNHLLTDESGQWLSNGKTVNKQGDAYLDLLQGNFWGAEGAILYRCNLFHAFRFNEARHRAEFYELNLLVSRFFPILAHDRPVLNYRKHPQGKSNVQKAMWENIQQILEQQIPFLLSPTEKAAQANGIENWRQHYDNGDAH